MRQLQACVCTCSGAWAAAPTPSCGDGEAVGGGRQLSSTRHRPVCWQAHELPVAQQLEKSSGGCGGLQQLCAAAHTHQVLTNLPRKVLAGIWRACPARAAGEGPPGVRNFCALHRSCCALHRWTLRRLVWWGGVGCTPHGVGQGYCNTPREHHVQSCQRPASSSAVSSCIRAPHRTGLGLMVREAVAMSARLTATPGQHCQERVCTVPDVLEPTAAQGGPSCQAHVL